MTFLVAASSPISGKFVVKQYAGWGILGADIPTTGDNGGSPVLNDDINPTGEYHWRVETPPSAGVLTIYPDLTFEWGGTGVPDGSYPWVYRLFEDGADQGTATVNQTVGAPSSRQYLYPSSDLSAGAWLPSEGSFLYACVDETTASDADYIYATSASPVEMGFSAGGNVNVNGGKLAYRVPPGYGKVTVVLKQGTNTLQTWGPHTLTGAAQDFEQVITANTADASNLRIYITSSL